MLLELVCREVGHDEGEHIADDSGKVAPSEALALYEIHHSTDEGKVPVVPQVDVHRAGGLGEHHQGVDTQADGNNESPHGGVVSYGGGGGPTHVENAEL